MMQLFSYSFSVVLAEAEFDWDTHCTIDLDLCRRQVFGGSMYRNDF